MRKAELALAIALTAVAIWLHVVRACHAGPLWRDEAGALQVALLPSLKEMGQVFQHEAFPLLFPLTVRTYASLAGTSDAAVRVFGLLVGLSLLGTIWYAAITLTGNVPLVSLAMLGTNALFLQWGDNLRGYGLGTAWMLLTFALIWRVIAKPSAGVTVAALIAAVCSVHVLYYNAVSLAAITAAATFVVLRGREWRRALLIVAIGILAALSLLPYRQSIENATLWNIVFTVPEFTFRLFRINLWHALGVGGDATKYLWVCAVAAGAAAATLAQARIASAIEPRRRNAGLYCLLLLLVLAPAYCLFLRVLRYPTQPWYYFALLALVAVASEGALLSLPWDRWRSAARIGLASLIAVSSFTPGYAAAHLRQTNMDLIADHLERNAAGEDVIVLAPWYLGVSFSRYYTGETPWITLPPVQDSRIHRYDLFKEKMMAAEPIAPVFASAERALANGHRVWVIGTLVFPRPGDTPLQLPPAPQSTYRWAAGAYAGAWNQQLGHFLRHRAGAIEVVSLGDDLAVSPYEKVSLTVVSGRRGDTE